jgi:tRNA-Thr(GGU) m(6)t(6)A37 methyltransferase TsaA
MKIEYTPIGTIHTPFKETEGMPIQPAGAEGVAGTIEIDPELVEGLKDLDGFSHIFLLYHFHRAGGMHLEVTPFLDSTPRGVFATRAPSRPNAIGLSVVRLKRVEGNVLHIENADILDETPLLDIKPFAPAFDHHAAESSGWLAAAGKKIRDMKSDNRFG